MGRDDRLLSHLMNLTGHCLNICYKLAFSSKFAKPPSVFLHGEGGGGVSIKELLFKWLLPIPVMKHSNLVSVFKEFI